MARYPNSLSPMGVLAGAVALLLLVSGANAWDEILTLDEADAEGFAKVVRPLVQMVGNCYRYPYVIPIPGWTQVDAVFPKDGGMNAMLYRDDINKGRMVLAIRGTDVTGSMSSKADICADVSLWGEIPILLHGDCSKFSSETLDYYTQAVDYTTKILKEHSQPKLLITGHSLGAGLAVMLAATFGTNPVLPVIAFSATGTKNVLEKRSLKLTADHNKKLYVVGDQWDEIMRTGTNWINQVGTLCLYQTNITNDCASCYQDGKKPSPLDLMTYPTTCNGPDLLTQASLVLSLTAQQLIDNTDHRPELELIEDVPAMIGSTADCLKCFYETHYWQHVIDVVELGTKPMCQYRPL